MTDSINVLRDRLAERESELKKLRARLKAAKEAAARPPVKSTISDIQKRYLSAVADLETKRSDAANPVIRASSDAVSTLASRFNQGIDDKKVERSRVSVRGDVTSAKKTFLKTDTSHFGSKSETASKRSSEPQPAELFVEDDDGLPSWAKNQQKRMIRKENARSSIRDVDVRELQGSVLESASHDGSGSKEETNVVPRGNVKAALAMWGKTADEDARLIAMKKEEEERKAAEQARLKKQREEEERRTAIRKAVEKFSKMSLSDLKQEPENEIELSAFLERKIVLVDKEIRQTEEELEKIEHGH